MQLHKSISLLPAPYLGNADLVYDATCKALSERQELVAWEQFGPAEWRLLPRMAETEGVAPLLYWKLGRTEDGGSQKTLGQVRGTELPTAAQQSLRASYYQTAARNALLFRALDRILAALRVGFKMPLEF